MSESRFQQPVKERQNPSYLFDYERSNYDFLNTRTRSASGDFGLMATHGSKYKEFKECMLAHNIVSDYLNTPIELTNPQHVQLLNVCKDHMLGDDKNWNKLPVNDQKNIILLLDAQAKSTKKAQDKERSEYSNANIALNMAATGTRPINPITSAALGVAAVGMNGWEQRDQIDHRMQANTLSLFSPEVFEGDRLKEILEKVELTDQGQAYMLHCDLKNAAKTQAEMPKTPLNINLQIPPSVPTPQKPENIAPSKSAAIKGHSLGATNCATPVIGDDFIEAAVEDSNSAIPVAGVPKPFGKDELTKEAELAAQEAGALAQQADQLIAGSDEAIAYVGGDPENPEKKPSSFLEKCMPKLAAVAVEVANLFYDFKCIKAVGDEFRNRRNAIVKQIASKMDGMQFQMDVADLNRHSHFTLVQTQQYIFAQFEEGIYLNLLEQRRIYSQVSEEASKIQQQISDYQNFQGKIDTNMQQVQFRLNKVMGKIQDLKYDALLPTAAMGVSTFAKFAPEGISSSVLTVANTAIGFFAAQHQEKVDRRLSRYGKLAQDKTIQAECLATLKNHVASQIDSLEYTKGMMQQSLLNIGNSAERRKELEKLIGETGAQLNTLRDKKNNLERDQQKLGKAEEKTKGKLKKLQKKSHKKKEEVINALQDNKIQQLKNELSLDHVTKELEKGTKAINGLNELLKEEQNLAGIRDFFDNYVEEKLRGIGLGSRDIEEKKLLMQKRYELKKQFAQVLEFNRELGETINSTGQNLVSVIHIFGGDKTASVVQGAMIAFNIWQTCETLLTYSAQQFVDLSKNGILDAIGTYGVTGMINQFLNPSLGLIQMGARLVNLVSARYGWDLFPDPVMQKFAALSKQISENLASLKENLVQELGGKLDLVLEALADQRHLMEASYFRLETVKHQVSDHWRYADQMRANESMERIDKQLRKIELKAQEIIFGENYPSKEGAISLYAMLSILTDHSLDSRYSKALQADQTLPIIISPINAINIIAEKLGFKDSSAKGLPNYKILHSIIGYALGEFQRVVKPNWDQYGPGFYPVFKMHFSNINQQAKNFLDFLTKLEQDLSCWVPQITREIERNIVILYEKFQAKINTISASAVDKRRLQDSIDGYCKDKYVDWLGRLGDKRITQVNNESKFVSDVLDCVTYKKYDIGKILLTLSQTMKGFFKTLEDKQFSEEERINFYYYLGGTFERTKWFAYEESSKDAYEKSAIKVSACLSKKNNGDREINVFLDNKPTSLGMTEQFIRRSYVPSLEKNLYEKNIQEKLKSYLSFVYTQILKISNSGGMPDQHVIEPSEFCPWPSILVFHHHNSLVPLLFPIVLINSLNTKSEVQAVFEAEKLAIGAKTIEYVFERTRTGDRYNFGLRYGCKKAERKVATPYVDIYISAFNYIMVHAFAKVDLKTEGYDFILKTNELLIQYMYGIGSVPGLGSYDLTAGRDLKNSKSIIVSNPVPHIGLVNCFAHSPTLMVYYNSEDYSPSVYQAMNDFIKNNTSSNILYSFFLPEQIVSFNVNHAELDEDIILAKRRKFDHAKNKLFISEKPEFDRIFSDISMSYEILIAAIRLMTGMDYHSIVLKITEFTKIIHPSILKHLYDNSMEKFLLLIKSEFVNSDTKKSIGKQNKTVSPMLVKNKAREESVKKLVDYITNRLGNNYIEVKAKIAKLQEISLDISSPESWDMARSKEKAKLEEETAKQKEIALQVEPIKPQEITKQAGKAKQWEAAVHEEKIKRELRIKEQQDSHNKDQVSFLEKYGVNLRFKEDADSRQVCMEDLYKKLDQHMSIELYPPSKPSVVPGGQLIPDYLPNVRSLVVVDSFATLLNSGHQKNYRYSFSDGISLINHISKSVDQEKIFLARPCLRSEVKVKIEAIFDDLIRHNKKAELIIVPVLTLLRWSLIVVVIDNLGKNMTVIFHTSDECKHIFKDVEGFLFTKLNNYLDFFKGKPFLFGIMLDQSSKFIINYRSQNSGQRHNFLDDNSPLIFDAISIYIRDYKDRKNSFPMTDNITPQNHEDFLTHQGKIFEIRKRHQVYCLAEGINVSENAPWIAVLNSLEKMLLTADNPHKQEILSWRLNVLQDFVDFLEKNRPEHSMDPYNTLEIERAYLSMIFSMPGKPWCKMKALFWPQKMMQNLIKLLNDTYLQDEIPYSAKDIKTAYRLMILSNPANPYQEEMLSWPLPLLEKFVLGLKNQYKNINTGQYTQEQFKVVYEQLCSKLTPKQVPTEGASTPTANVDNIVTQELPPQVYKTWLHFFSGLQTQKETVVQSSIAPILNNTPS